MRAHRFIPGIRATVRPARTLAALGMLAALLVIGAAASADTGSVKATFATQASKSISVGAGSITDTAILLGDPLQPKPKDHPTGTIGFALYGPNDPTCANPPVFTQTIPAPTHQQVVSPPFTPTLPGDYVWVDTYSGDAAPGRLGSARWWSGRIMSEKLSARKAGRG